MMKLKELLGDNMKDVIELIKKDDICKIYENVSISKYRYLEMALIYFLVIRNTMVF